MSNLQHGDVVLVVGSDSLLLSMLGQYGVVTDPHFYAGKVIVEFNAGVTIGEHFKRGSMSHTARPSDLKKIGRVDMEQWRERTC